MKKTLRRVGYCPHCGNRAPQRIIHKQRYFERTWSGQDGTESDRTPWSTYVACCETCNQLFLYDNPGDQTDDERFETCDLVYPRSGQLPMSVPRSIAVTYDEAIRIKERAPNAFAVLIRRGLDGLCEDNGAKGRNLQSKLKKLADNGVIPPLLAEATDLLRLLGNIGAHSATESVHPLLANAMDEFFRAVVEYVYIAPARLKDFRRKMETYRKKA
jgi:hypothetical protein